jgi:branched-chain amino acid transport system permease protein
LLAVLIGVPLTVLFGIALEWLLLSRLYRREHLQQVLATYALILIFEELRSILVGDDVHGVEVPTVLAASIPLTQSLSYPVYRLFLSGVCLLLAGGLYVVIHRTRLGMKIRAGNSNREMAQAMGVNIDLLYRVVFGLGVGLAAFAGMVSAPVSSVFPGMGNQVLILCFVVVILGGIGSVWGALGAALAIGFADTFGKVLFSDYAGFALYLPMGAIILWRPEGLSGRT